MTKQRPAQPVATDAPRQRKELRERYGPFWEFRNRFYWVGVQEARLLLRALGLNEDCWQCIRLRVVEATKGGLSLSENKAEAERFGLSKFKPQSLQWRAVRAAAVVNFGYRAVDLEVIEAIDITGLNHGRWLYGDFMLKRSTKNAGSRPRPGPPNKPRWPHVQVIREAKRYLSDQGQPARANDVLALLTSEVPDSVRDAIEPAVLVDDSAVEEEGGKVFFRFANRAATAIKLGTFRNILSAKK